MRVYSITQLLEAGGITREGRTWGAGMPEDSNSAELCGLQTLVKV